MASSSNTPPASARIQDYEYLYASNTNVSNFVSVKLSGYGNYHLWKTQMLCLMEAHDMCGLVDDGPGDLSAKIMKKYDSLLKGWIFGSVSEDVLRIVVDPKCSAKDVWIKLECFFDSTLRSQQEAETNDNIVIREQMTDAILTDIEITDKNMDPAESEAKLEDANRIEKIDSARLKWEIKLSDAIVQGDSYELQTDEDKDMIKKGFNSTMLHVAVGISRNDVVRDILRNLNDELTDIKNNDGSTALHIAAIVGNTSAAEILIKRDKRLLYIADHKGQTPLVKAYENMHFTTAAYLLSAAESDRKQRATNIDDKSKAEGDGENIKKDVDIDAKSKKKSSVSDVDVKIGINILVQAISAKEYDFASDLMLQKPEYVVSNDNVLMAMARTFPSGLDFGETLIYPSLANISFMMVKRTKRFYNLSMDALSAMKERGWSILNCENEFRESVLDGVKLIIGVPIVMVYWMYRLINLLVLTVYFPFSMLYFLLWKTIAAVGIVPSIKNIEQKKKDREKAKEVLKLVCDTIIDNCLGDDSCDIYTGPILEAACQDAYEVVDQILGTWPEAILCKDKNGYDIIQLATIHRSEKIYNLIYMIGERKSVYRTIEDSSKNNMLHLAGRLGPSNKLAGITGAALQLQRELQWCQEVKKLVFPTYVTRENIFMETPEMIFTREHKDLVIEGEKWIRTVAESCSITAALITTIVFAAAITVPGGSSQETGTPVFMKETAFAVFAVSDAISLFSSVTALLVFLSIVSTRFAQQDFLVSLPRLMIIGLCTLLLSTTAMIVAFCAIFFLVFSQHKLWMLAPICGLAFVPIAMYFILQFPLILDLFRSTYISKFGKSNHRKSKFNPKDIRLFFGK